MFLRIKYLGFDFGWPTFKRTSIITRLLKDGDTIVDDINDSNVLVIGTFISLDDLNMILNYKHKRILYVSEPIQRIYFAKLFNFLFENNLYDYALGSIANKENKWYKYPIYMDVFDLYGLDIYEKMNDYVKTVDIRQKRFCSLISRHDLGNCRIKVYNMLKNYGEIDCPGQLLNNMSNEMLDRIGIPEFIKGYIFNICNENFGESHPGYITEKLMNCCLGGAIPIYYGKLDEIDKQIFNTNRILIIENIDDLNELEKTITIFCQNFDILEKFYRQPMFVSTAKDVLVNMKNYPLSMMNNLKSLI
jgi:hypothetical protein